ncbi:MAG: amidohydrolase family protein [Bryobacteraceae bacterium]
MRRRHLLSIFCMAATRARAAEPHFECIDTHTHMHRSAPALLAALQQAKWRCLSICDSREIGDQPSILDEMIRGTKILHVLSRGLIAWATTFDAREFETPGFADRVITALQRDFKEQAVAVKIWKNIGLAIRSKSGQFLMPDSPVLTPIFAAVERSGRTLISHLADPDIAWQPLEGSESGYYRTHPEWHMYGRTEVPSKSAILEARDRVLARHRGLRVIGCHLGSNEDDLDQLGRRLDAHPNFAVDVASRVRYLTRMDSNTVRQFVTKYQDRIIYATDFALRQGDDARAAKSLLSVHEREWNYFSGDLGLPEPILQKIFRENAVRWIPGITAAI